MRQAAIQRRERDRQAINFALRNGMSRRSLIRIYGDELVNAELGLDPLLA